MKTRTLTALMIAIGLVASTSFAQIDRSKKPEPGPAPKASFPAYNETVLPNGLRVFVITNPAQPVVTLRLMIKSGACFDGDKSGTAELTTDLLTKGTKKRSALEFAKAADEKGVEVSASAEDDFMSVSGSGLKKFMSTLLDLMSDAVIHPTFAAAELEKMRTMTLSSLAQQRKDPENIANRLEVGIGFNVHPYAKFATEATVKSITRKDLAAFHKTHFLPNNATLAVVGDVTLSEIEPVLKKYFGEWKQGTVPVSNFPSPKPVQGRTVNIVDLGTSQTQTALAVVTTAIKRNDPDWIPFSLLNTIIGGGSSGRLFMNLREKHAFTYGAYSSIDGRASAGIWTAATDVRRVATDSAAMEILGEMQRLIDEPVSAEELAMNKEYVSGTFLLSLENPARMAVRVQDLDLYHLPKEYYQTYVARINAVTADDLNRVARKYFTRDGAAITAVGDASVITAPLEKLGTVRMYDTDIKPLDKQAALAVDIDAETLIARYIKAIGGAQKLSAVKDRTMSGDMTMHFGPQSITGAILDVSKAPNKRYVKSQMHMQGQLMEQEMWIDGTHVERTQPMSKEVQSLTGDELAQELETAVFNPVQRYKELGYTADVKAKKVFDGKPCYALVLTRQHGATTYYIDAATYLLAAEENIRKTEVGEQTVTVRYSDYRPVDGALLPFSIKTDIGPMSVDITVKSYTQNTNVPDNTFVRH